MPNRIKLLFLTAAIAAAQQSPTFRVGTKLVQVDVVVRDKHGPATGLTKQDFTVLDNGKPQEIAVFSVKSSFVKSTGTLAPAPIALPPGVVSNRLEFEGDAPGTATVVLLDRRNTERTDQAYAIQRIVRYLETRRKRDRIGIYTSGRDGFQAVQDLTDDKELLRRAANSLKPQETSYICADLQGREAEACTDGEILGRVLDTKHALKGIARHLAKVPGRKNLIWVTAGFPIIWPAPPSVPLYNFTPDMEEAARALNNANVALYAVDARGLIGALGQLTGVPNAESRGPASLAAMMRQNLARAYRAVGPTGIDTMNLLAGLTGGDVYFNTNGIEDSIQTAVEDADLTYTLGFYPAQESKDRDLHSLKVKVARGGVSVRYRENYSASLTPAKAHGRPTNDRPTMDQLLNDPLNATQLELFAETAPDQAHPGSYLVRVSVDLHDVQLEHQNTSWVGLLNISFFVEGSKSGQTIAKKIEIHEEQLAAGLEKPLVVETSIALEAPRGILHVVAQDQATGAAGSLRLPLGRK
jgi:VWFA-related protein